MDPAVLAALPQSEVNRQTIIHKLISNEVQYHKDLDVIDSVRFLTLRLAGCILPLTVFPRK
jgi:RHO1 GDP-GTP exchange protein 1/2